jgi:hypothetical protein
MAGRDRRRRGEGLLHPDLPTAWLGTLARYLVIVRRDSPDLFETLRGYFGDDVILDRRTGERRQGQRRKGALAAKAPGRRRVERRGPPPDTWTRHGFILVHQEQS